MTHVCRQCARVNPADAAFCYWDGAYLAGGAGGPINAGSAPFPNQFIFPGGQACRNFDQLATTCQNNWKAAVDLLKQGFFATFLGGLGRADLAMAAKEAAKFPDPDRGLDQLLAKLPTQVLQPPKLQVEPTTMSLGVLAMGTNRKIDLHLSNLGMRLVYGTVVSDCKWLTFGDGKVAAQKHFQFGAETNIAVQIKGQYLRAGNQPLEGHMSIDSNAGNVTVSVRADVPITPFSDGVLAGSHTPRQIAEKARAHPKEAAVLFEKGLVSKWFTKNGWTYPVQGPNVGGLGGVQQFFEALGLAKPPKVGLKTPSLQLKGDPGQTLSASIEVSTQEKKHVFAFAVCDRPWVVPGLQPKQSKNPMVANIPLTIQVPGTPGQVQQAKLVVTANGNQKFPVPLTLTISGSPGDYVPAMAIPLSAGYDAGGAVPIMAVPITASGRNVRPEEIMVAEIISSPGGRNHSSGASRSSPFAVSDASGSVIDLGTRAPKKSVWFHFLPLLALVLVLGCLVLRDLIGTPTGIVDTGTIAAEIDPTQRLAVYFDDKVSKGFVNSMNFGLVMIDPAHPQDSDPKRLTYDPYGRTNSTVISVNGHDKVFGDLNSGKWETKSAKAGEYGGKSVSFQIAPERILVTQTVQIMPSEAEEVKPGIYKRLLNSCLIKYKVENKDARSNQVGLRVVMDTFIGGNDGVPFTVPGIPGLVSTFKDFSSQKDIPDFIQALERPDLEDPGTVVQMNLKLSKELAPDRVSLTAWPGQDLRTLNTWDVRIDNFRNDSCIVLYWNPIEMKPGQSREMAFSYGLGSLSKGKLRLTVGGTLAVGREMTVVAYVAEPKPGEKATLKLPDGFEFLDGTPATQNVSPAEAGADGKTRPSPVTWRIRPNRAGQHLLSVTTSTGLSASQRVTILQKGIF
jgi:hypothetical protein